MPHTTKSVTRTSLTTTHRSNLYLTYTVNSTNRVCKASISRAPIPLDSVSPSGSVSSSGSTTSGSVSDSSRIPSSPATPPSDAPSPPATPQLIVRICNFRGAIRCHRGKCMTKVTEVQKQLHEQNEMVLGAKMLLDIFSSEGGISATPSVPATPGYNKFTRSLMRRFQGCLRCKECTRLMLKEKRAGRWVDFIKTTDI